MYHIVSYSALTETLEILSAECFPLHNEISCGMDFRRSETLEIRHEGC